MDTNLYWRHLEAEHPRAEAFCRRLTGDRDEGDDLYQDALVRALTRVQTLRDPASFRPWLYRIIVNTYRNRCRSPWWRRRIPLTPAVCATLAGDDPAAAYATRRWLERALAALRPDERALVTLFEIDGWGITELARLFRRPEGTIKARLARGRRKMRTAIENHLPARGRGTPETEIDENGVEYAVRPIKPPQA